MKVAIQRINLASLGKMGCLLGVVAAFLPSLLCSLLGLTLANTVLRWLESLQDLTLSFLGQEIIRIDLIQFLGLQRLPDVLHSLTSASAATVLLVVLIAAVVAGVVLALIVILLGLVYNLLAAGTGGVVVELASVSRQENTEPGTTH